MSRVWIKLWQTNTDYVTTDKVTVGEVVYECHTDHNSWAVFLIANWDLVNMLAFHEVYNSNVSNCNDLSTGTQMAGWGNPWPAENSAIFIWDTDWTTIFKDGRVLAMSNMYFESTTSRTNVWIEFSVNWVRQNIMWASSYIRNVWWHNEASSHISQILDVNAWDKIGVIMYRMANSWTVVAPAMKSNLLLNFLDNE